MVCLPSAGLPVLQELSRVSKPITKEDIRKVHIMLEHCLQASLSKQEAIATLQRLGVTALVAVLVWDRLEEENPDYFRVYYARQAEMRAAREGF